MIPTALFLALAVQPALAQLGTVTGGAGDEPMPVEVANEEPVPVIAKGTSLLLDIVGSTQIEHNEEYSSPYFDVQEYRNVTFYIIPEKVLNEPHSDLLYQLDAYFSAESGTTSYKSFQDDKAKLVGSPGAQEFGAMQVEGSAEKSFFTKTTTGVTGGSRVLTTPVYGPYVRVVLRNLTQGERRKFKVVAFLTR